MRLAIACGVTVRGIGTLMQPTTIEVIKLPIGLLEMVLGVAFLIGFLTPIVGVLATLGSIGIGVSWFVGAGSETHDGALMAFALAVISLSLVLLGPGAYSLDARLFGHREIIIPGSARLPKR